MEEEENKDIIEPFDIMEPSQKIPEKKKNSEEIKNEIGKEEKKEIQNEEKGKKKWKFPSAYSVLLIIQVLVFILTYIIPKGRYATIYYDGKNLTYTYANPDKEPIPLDPIQSNLKYLNISIDIEDFKNGHIKKPIAVPNSYERIHGKKTDFFDLFINPILGIIETADISFCVMILGGCLNICIPLIFSLSLSIFLKGGGEISENYIK